MGCRSLPRAPTILLANTAWTQGLQGWPLRLERMPLGTIDEHVIVTGIGGKVAHPRVDRVSRFDWGEATFRDIEAIGIDLKTFQTKYGTTLDGLIGCEFLEPFEVVFDYGRAELRCYAVDTAGARTGTDRSDTGTHATPLSLINNLPVIEERIGNRDVRLGLDSGAQINWLSHALKDDIKANFQFARTVPIVGADGHDIEADGGRVDSIVIDNLIFRDMPVVMSKPTNFVAEEVDGLLGFPFFAKHPLILNLRQRTVAFITAPAEMVQ